MSIFILLAYDLIMKCAQDNHKKVNLFIFEKEFYDHQRNFPFKISKILLE